MGNNILQQTLFNRLNDDLNCAITKVGGNTCEVNDIFDYSKVICQQLTAKYNIEAGPGIEIKIIKPESHGCDCGCGCPSDQRPTLYIGANANALITKDIDLPNGDQLLVEDQVSIQDVFESIFNEFLQGGALKSGLLITSTVNGIDISDPDNPQSGLLPSTKYIRLNISNQEKPIYINIQELLEESKRYTDTSIQESSKNVMHYIGESSTNPLVTDPVVIIEGECVVNFVAGDLITYEGSEFIYSKTGKWEVLGSAGTVSKSELDAEIENRKQADEDLLVQINIEEAARQEADLNIQRQLNTLSDLGLKAIHFLGYSATDPGTGEVVIPGVDSFKVGDLVFYNDREYIYDPTNQWRIIGDDGHVTEEELNNKLLNYIKKTELNPIEKDMIDIIIS